MAWTPGGVNDQWITTELRLSGTLEPLERQLGMVLLAGLTLHETGQPPKFARITDVRLDSGAPAGLVAYLAHRAPLAESEPRLNQHDRLSLVLENTTNAPLSFSDVRVVLGGEAPEVTL